MSTNETKKKMTIEQKDRKNQLAREKRLRDKENLIQLRQKEVEEQIPIEDDSDDYEDDTKVEDNKVEEVVEEQENPEEIRKKQISEKRRASLAIARSKIKPKSQITKEKDEEIAKIKEENEKLKYETQKAKEVKPTIIKKYIIEEPAQKQRQKSVPREKRASAEIPSAKEPSIDYLAQQSYAEQLQARLRRDVYTRVMNDTFM
jgi:Zn-dependent metalloprotease